MLFDIPTIRIRAAKWAQHDAIVAARAPRVTNMRGHLSALTIPSPRRGRRLTREEFDELLADYASEFAARAQGLPVPPPTARRRVLRVAPITAPVHRYVAANDNRRPVVVANDGPTDDWLAERDAAGYATKSELPATRIERALIADKSPEILPLRRAMETLRYAELTVANDNTPIAEDGDDNSGFGLETAQNQGSIKPSIGEQLRAMSDGLRPHIVTTKAKSGKPREMMLRITGEHTFDEGWHIIGAQAGRRLVGLVFQGGKLVAYGDRNRKRRAPWYDATRAAEAKVDEDSETAKHIAAQDAEDRAYVALQGCGSSQHVADNDNVTRFPAGVARGYGRLAGVSEMKGVGKGKTSATRHDVLRELDRIDAVAELDPADVKIIEAAMADATFSQIGIGHGYAPSSASRMGRKLVLRAANNIQKKIAA